MNLINSAFLGKEGITSTSANHLANLAKEQCKEMESYLQNISFLNTDMALIGTPKEPYSRGYSSLDTSVLEKVGKLTSFIAFMREAIKYKKDLLEHLSEYYSIEEHVKEHPELKVQEATRPDLWTKEMLIEQMDIKQRERYLHLEAMASVYGKYIHPDGSFSVARSTLLSTLHNPSSREGTGRDTVLYSYSPSIPVEKVNELFLAAQSQYRSYEAQLNQIKAEIEEKVTLHNLEEGLKRAAEKKVIAAQNDQLISSYTNKIDELSKEISQLKIRIPEELKSTFEYLNSLGK